MNLEVFKSLLRYDEAGVIRVNQSRVTLDAMVLAFREGASAEEIAARFPELSLAAIYAAIAFYLQHRAEVDGYVAQRESQAAALRERFESKPEHAEFRERLLARVRTAPSA